MAEISPASAAALYAQQAAPEIIARTTEVSTALQALRTQPMGTKTTRMAVIDSVPTAGWVKPGANGSPGRKPVSDMAWAGATLTAEEIAVIVVIPEEVMDDTLGNIEAEVRNRCSEAIAVALDATVYFGVNKPDSFPDGLVPQAIAAGNVITPGTGVDLGADFNEALMLVEDAEGDATFAVGARRLRGAFRGLRSANGDLIYAPGVGMAGAVPVSQVWGVPLFFPSARAWDRDEATALIGDGEYAIIGVRSDIQVASFDTGVVQDPSGAIIRNLMQDDSIALRVRARFGFATANVPGGDFPFAVLGPQPDGGGTGGERLAVQATTTEGGTDVIAEPVDPVAPADTPLPPEAAAPVAPVPPAPGV